MLWVLYLINCLFHYFSPPGVFCCSFNWEWFCLFILFNFLCLYEFRWSSHLTWSWRGVPAQTVCAHASGGRATLTWMQVTSFHRVSWQVSPWQVVGLEMEGLEQRQVKGGTSPLLSGPHYTFGVRSDPKLLVKKPWGWNPHTVALFLLSICLPLS